MSTEDTGARHKDQRSRWRLKVRPRTDAEESVITEEDDLLDETIRHTVPPPAQENRG